MKKYKNLFSQVKILEGHRLPRPEPLDLIDQVIGTGTGTGTEAGNSVYVRLSTFVFMHGCCHPVSLALSCYLKNVKFTHNKNTFHGSLKTFKPLMVLTAKCATV
jgi:hypothetical protein